MALFQCMILSLTVATTAQRWVEHKGMWYFFPPEDKRLPFFEAQKYCMNISSQMVTIADEGQNNFLKSQIQSQAWIGYYHRSDWFCDESMHYPKWTDDSTCMLQYRNSLPGGNETESYGVALNGQGTWIEMALDAKLYFFCQWQCETIIISDDAKNIQINGLYKLTEKYQDGRKYYENYIDSSLSEYLVYYGRASNTKIWLLGPNVGGGSYIYTTPSPNVRYVPDIWTIPTNWRIRDDTKADFRMFCKLCQSVYIDYDDSSGFYNGTYTVLKSYENNETCTSTRSKIYVKINENSTLYLYVGNENGIERWYVGSNNCTEGWLLYNSDYTPLPCWSKGLWLDRASTETTTPPTTKPVANTATTIPTTMLQSTPKTEQTEDPFNIFLIIIPVLGILLIIIIITIIIVCVRKRNEQDEKPPPDIVETSPLPSASQVDEHTNVVKRNGDVGIRNSFQDESIFAQHDELPEKAIKKKTKKK